MGGKTCAICEKPSGMYPLCTACFKLKDEGNIEKCPECGAWHYTDKPCQCKKQESAKADLQADEKKSNCLICNEESNGQLFCKSCYYKYRNKTISLKITDCKDIELMNEEYTSDLICIDGHKVKSKSEKIIDDYLYNKNIKHAYEKALPIDDNPDNDLHPDFYLPELDLYIEHWGISNNNKNYKNSKEYKLNIYKEKAITLICTYEKDINDIETSMQRKLEYYKKNSLNYIN